jgi:hypothetical protein
LQFLTRRSRADSRRARSPIDEARVTTGFARAVADGAHDWPGRLRAKTGGTTATIRVARLPNRV